ncbi:hypothetical protein G6F61_014197 [Rhizopus arrhizus]|nr:hypothetical protein G6F61_014197 [Rhizopus arrhizus]
MPVSDYELVKAWQQVLTLSQLQAGQTVTVLTSAATHPQTLSTALLAAQSMGAVVNRLDLPPVNGEKALSRDSLAYLGKRSGAGPDDAAVLSGTARHPGDGHQAPAGSGASRGAGAAGAHRGGPRAGEGGGRAHRRRARDERGVGGGHRPALPAG